MVDQRVVRWSVADYLSGMASVGFLAFGGELHVRPSSFPSALQSFAQSYGYDTFVPAALYLILRHCVQAGRMTSGVLACAPGCLFEACRRFGGCEGMYDSKDFLAYAAGTAIGFVVSELFKRTVPVLQAGIEKKSTVNWRRQYLYKYKHSCIVQ